MVSKPGNKLISEFSGLGIEANRDLVSTGAELDFEKIISFLKEQGASSLQLPERIEFVDEMPYTKAEKIDKQSLVKDIEQKIKIEK